MGSRRDRQDQEEQVDWAPQVQNSIYDGVGRDSNEGLLPIR